MLLSVMLIGTSVLTITSLAGYLMLQRIKMGNQFIDSTKAIFAADAGIECEYYNYFKNGGIVCGNLSFSDPATKVQTSVVLNASGTPQYIRSTGSSNKFKRAFLVEFK